ncbi:MAG: hypothetical protein E7606_05730 [Ruminococcaceae bacterium]|nr:hypothetical protein [Oscillospiraceae bacterium]
MTEIVGNDALKSRLCRDILDGTLPHALILEGAKGSGKHTVAHMCAAALACTEKKNKNLPIPCLLCHDCKKILEKKSPDVIVIGTEEKASIGVEAIRFLKEDVHTIPNDLEHKIYIIEDADRMTVQAQNALLLTLEEPPAYVHFFLLCENANLLLETIRSRAPILRTEPLTEEEIDRYLVSHDKRAAQMKLSSPKEYALLLKASGTGIGQALGYLAPNALSPILEGRAFVEEVITSAIYHRNMLPLLPRFSSKREALREQLFGLLDALRDLILLKKSESVCLTFFVDRNEAVDLCDRVSLPFLYGFYEAVQKAIDDSARNANVRLSLMRMLMDAHLI